MYKTQIVLEIFWDILSCYKDWEVVLVKGQTF
jgi:hypothetical protein